MEHDDLYRESASLVDILRYRADHQPERTAFLFLQDGEVEGASLTYRTLDERARAVAGHLQALMPPVGRALLFYPPGLEFITAFLGCLYAGVAPVPLSPPRRVQSLARLRAIVADAQVTLAITTSDRLDALARWASEEPGLATLQWLATDALPDSRADVWRSPRSQRDSLAFIQYTSGSTATPKGVMVSHGNLLHNSEYLRQSFELTPESVSVTWLPSFHDMGLIDGVLQPLYGGFLGVILPPVSFLLVPASWLQAITRYRATHSGGPNFAYDLCVRRTTAAERATLDLSSWVSAYNGSEPVRRDTLERFSEHFRPCGFQPHYFYPCYGMAEATLIISGGRVRDAPIYFAADADALEAHRVAEAGPTSERVKHLVGCGRPWLDTEIVIADLEALTRCPAGRVGEIWVAGSGVTKGYWNRPALQADTFAWIADTGEGPFLRTGDLGFIRDGELFVTGRIKDVIIIRGMNHYPQDIEQTVQESYPGLQAASGAAFTVEVGGREQLVVVQEVERSHLESLEVPAAIRAIREAVANEHGLQVHAAALIKPGRIPRTSSSKIQRHECRQQFLKGTLGVVDGASKPSRG